MRKSCLLWYKYSQPVAGRRRFNTIAHPEEKLGKHKPDERSITDFNNFMMEAGLSNAGYGGSNSHGQITVREVRTSLSALVVS